MDGNAQPRAWRIRPPRTMVQKPLHVRYQGPLILMGLGLLTLATGTAVTIGVLESRIVYLGLTLIALGVLLVIAGSVFGCITHSRFRSASGAHGQAENIHLLWYQTPAQTPCIEASTWL